MKRKTLVVLAVGSLLCSGQSSIASMSTLYFVDRATDYIYRSDLDGGNLTPLLSVGQEPVGISVYGDHIYWSDDNLDEIYRSDLNGQNVETLISEPRITGLDGVTAFGSSLYFVDRATDYIYRSDLDGGNLTSLLSVGQEPVGISVYGDHIYWSDDNLDEWPATTTFTNQRQLHLPIN